MNLPDEVLLNLAFSIGLRVAFLSLSRLFVKRTLLADLEQVISEESLSTEDDAGNSRPPSPLRRSPTVRTAGNENVRAHKTHPRLATFVFCMTFSECGVLCTVVLLESLINQRTRWHNWTIAIGVLLCIIFAVVPLGQCWMVVSRQKKSSGVAWWTILATAILFTIYELVLNQGGVWLSDLLGIKAGAHHFGILNDALERICAPGTILIAALSGAGAVNTAWDAYEWRQRFKGRPVTDSTISMTESALRKAREDLYERQRELDNVSTLKSESASFFSKLLSSDSASRERNALNMEIIGLKSLEGQMRRDLSTLNNRKRTIELSGTLKGQLLSSLGWCFTLYCVMRVASTSVSLLLGLDKADSQTSSNPSGTITRMLNTISSLLGFNTDFSTYSHLITLGLTGTIILVNLRTVLVPVSRLLKVASAGSSAAFMMLFLSQLLAIYLLTSLISLPDSGDSATHELLRLLPDFHVFLRLFDFAFVLAAIGWAIARFLDRKIRADDYSQSGMV